MAVDYEEGRRLLVELGDAEDAWEAARGGAAKLDAGDAQARAYDRLADWMITHAEALLNPDPWRPISEMTDELRDGRAVLLWAPDYCDEPSIGRWSETTSVWHTDNGSMEDGPSGDPELCSGPTHFRELKGPGHG